MKPILRVLARVVGVPFETVAVIRGAVGALQRVIVPCAAEVVLGSRAEELRLTIDDKQIIAFAPPAGLIGIDAENATDVMAFALGVEEQVVVFADRIERIVAAVAIRAARCTSTP